MQAHALQVRGPAGHRDQPTTSLAFCAPVSALDLAARHPSPALRQPHRVDHGRELWHWDSEVDGMGGPAEIWIRRGASRALGAEIRRAPDGEDARKRQLSHAVVTFSLRCMVRGHEAGCTAYAMLKRLRNRLWLPPFGPIRACRSCQRSGPWS